MLLFPLFTHLGTLQIQAHALGLILLRDSLRAVTLYTGKNGKFVKVALLGVMATLVNHILQLAMLISLMAVSVSHCLFIGDDEALIFFVIHSLILE